MFRKREADIYVNDGMLDSLTLRKWNRQRQLTTIVETQTAIQTGHGATLHQKQNDGNTVTYLNVNASSTVFQKAMQVYNTVAKLLKPNSATDVKTGILIIHTNQLTNQLLQERLYTVLDGIYNILYKE